MTTKKKRKKKNNTILSQTHKHAHKFMHDRLKRAQERVTRIETECLDYQII